MLFISLWALIFNGYAFGDTDGLVKIVEESRKKVRRIPDLELPIRASHSEAKANGRQLTLNSLMG